MTNTEKYLKDNVSVEELCKNFYKYLVRADICGIDKANIGVYIQEFMQEQVIPTLTEDERVILKNLPREWKYINKIDGRVCIKQELEDSTNLGINYLFPDLFQFIKERRRI